MTYIIPPEIIFNEKSQSRQPIHKREATDPLAKLTASLVIHLNPETNSDLFPQCLLFSISAPQNPHLYEACQ
ncbi:Uncharacterised protein [Mycobacteroides abscessus subsp. abscessus]|nr:Uncharacterised protein [Mycobacteroides abscessus subsp. abscessus]